uniref:non-specific serine/threonine protein kinase n=1 Tax=Anthurium amnicola TaxID=1678845 RepID=A0A1D1Z7C0_9ARAE
MGVGDPKHAAGAVVARKLLSDTPSLLGLRFPVLVGICAGGLVVACVLFVLFLVHSGCRSKRRQRTLLRVKHPTGPIPAVTKEIAEVKTGNAKINAAERPPGGGPGVEEGEKDGFGSGSGRSSGKGSKVVSGGPPSVASTSSAEMMVNIGWGRWYTLAELHSATGGFGRENVVGEGGYGIVYRGVLPDSSVVAVKNLLDNKGQAEKEFKVEVEAIGKVRHKNLVGLIGYCAEGRQRMLVYEYVDNGNLDQWLHGDVGPVSPLTWDMRMKIVIGTAKGIAYLHEGLEPKVVHRDIKSSNILLDKKWNPKVSDFGLAKLLGSGSSYVTTRVMGTFGYVAPEYASTGMLNEGSDIYSFGVLLMEIISGRSPVDYSRPPGEVNLVEWFKGMVGSRRGEEVVDPLIETQPSPRALKRVLLVCLRCIDVDAQKRPKMGQIVHMLEGDEFPFRTERRSVQEITKNSQAMAPETISKSPFRKVAGADCEKSIWR